MKITCAVVALCVFAYVSAVVTVDPHDATKIQYEGRFAFPTTPKKHALYDWSGVSYTIRFTKTKALPTLLIKDTNNMYNIYISTAGASTKESILTGTRDAAVKKYTIANTTPLDASKTYTLRVEKRTEASLGVVQFHGFEFTDGTEVLPVLPLNKLKMAFIGDSITCGYGADGKLPCHFTRQTENFRHSYAGITAALLNATYHTTSWSGKGMVRNYGDKKTVSVDPVPKFFTNTIANQPKHQWDFSKYIPDVVVIALGTNDFSTAPRPSYAEYGGAYNKLLDLLRAKYGPNTKIFCMSGPLKLQFVDRVVAERKDKNVFFANTANLLKADDWGCDGHPNAKGAAKMANVLAGIIKNAK